jgi:hypothetical protein
VSAVLLPFVCAWCERVRTNAGRWEEVDASLQDPAAATHGICPECLAEETRAVAAQPIIELR